MEKSEIEYRLRAIATKERAVAVFEEDGEERLGFGAAEHEAMKQLVDAFNGTTPWGVSLIKLDEKSVNAALDVCEEYLGYLYEVYSGHKFGEEKPEEKVSAPSEDEQGMIVAVRKYAYANYEKDGWDTVIECMEDGDILELISDAKATNSIDAINAVYKFVKLRHDHEREIASGFDF